MPATLVSTGAFQVPVIPLSDIVGKLTRGSSTKIGQLKLKLSVAPSEGITIVLEKSWQPLAPIETLLIESGKVYHVKS